MLEYYASRQFLANLALNWRNDKDYIPSSGLAELGDGVDPEITGRPSYHPSVLLKLYIYGYLNRVQSSRRLEHEAGRNVEVMWLTGRLVPDHKTIADFRKDTEALLSKPIDFAALRSEIDSRDEGLLIHGLRHRACPAFLMRF
jgi:Transposase domain (DUF772)